MRGVKNASILLMSLCLGLTACSSSGKDKVRAAKMQARYILHSSGSTVYSPNGEPLTGGVLGRPSCLEAASEWFARVDADHDNSIDLTEFLADARIQFLRMDLDGDGAIYPSELLTFRGALQGPSKRTKYAPDESFDADRAKLMAMGLIPEDDPDMQTDKNHFHDFSDPVMSADVNLDFRVTQAEFTAQAQEIFKTLDLDHDGKIERIEILAACPPASLIK